MKSILKTDLVIFFNSPMGYLLICVWLIVLSSFLWVFPGNYNIPDAGYSSLSSFFSLAPILLILFIPAVTMRVFAEEKRLGTLPLLFTRPIGLFKIIFSKYLASVFMMILALLPTLIYVVSISLMSNRSLDPGEVIGGYIGLMGVVFSFVAIGVFASSLTHNQLIAFLLGVSFCFLFYFGFDLFASLSNDGSFHNLIQDMGMYSHYNTLKKGVIDSRSLIYFSILSAFFLLATYLLFLSANPVKKIIKTGIPVFVFLFVICCSHLFYIRFDVTEEKKYTLSVSSKELIQELDKPLEVILYLDGDLNPAFDRLRSSAISLLEELSQYTSKGIFLKKINPGEAPNELLRQENYLRMEQNGMPGISVNERDRGGRVLSRVVFPWAEIVYDGDTIPIRLLKRNISLSSLEIINSSIDELEYNFLDAVRVLSIDESSSIAFIEGHGELEEPYVYEAMEILSRYYQIDRGIITGNIEELSPYKVLIIAAPKIPFTEMEKFVLDQYLMQGGSIFFLIDGIKISENEFSVSGESPSLKNELNLDDLLFTYGIRIEPVTVMDMNCTFIRLASSDMGTQESYTTMPWYFSPLLEPVSSHPITHNISPLKSEFVSTISWVGDDTRKKTILLTSSSNAHSLMVPEKISLRYVELPADPAFFNEAYLPVAGLIEGRFESVFLNRSIPEGVVYHPSYQRLNNSDFSRLVVAASGSLIKNEWQGRGSQTVPVPLGFDMLTGEQLGNADFIVNTVNYLAGNEKWLDLRSRNYKLRLLDKAQITSNLLVWQLINTLFPVLLVIIAGFTFILVRKKKYHKL